MNKTKSVLLTALLGMACLATTVQATGTNAVPTKAFWPTLYSHVWTPLSQPGQVFYQAKELTLDLGPTSSFQNSRSQNTFGGEVGGTYWLTLHMGTGVHAGINNLTRPNPLLFDWSQVDYSVRFPIRRFAPGATLGLGKSFIDGSTYTDVAGDLEFRLTPNFGLRGSVDYKLATTKSSTGLGWTVATVFSF